MTLTAITRNDLKLLNCSLYKQMSIINQNTNQIFSFIDTVDQVIVGQNNSVVCPARNQKSVTVSGWVVDSALENKVEDVFVCIKNTEFKAIYGSARPDVAINLQKSTLLNTGYSCFIPVQMLDEGLNTLSLKIIFKNGEGTFYNINATNFQVNLPVITPFSLELTNTRSIEYTKDEVLISIIIPCYNDGKYLPEALASIDELQNIRYEVILINDGSTDTFTLDFLNKLDKNRYTVLHQENKGVSAARNAGIKIAKAEYILPLDSDNKLIPEYLYSGLAFLDSNPDYAVFYSDQFHFGEQDGIFASTGFDIVALITDNCVDTCALFRKELWEQCGGYDENMVGFEDWELWMKAYAMGFRFYHHPEPLFYYRVKSKEESLNLKCQNPANYSKLLSYIYSKHSRLIRQTLKDQKSLGQHLLLEIQNKEAEIQKLKKSSVTNNDSLQLDTKINISALSELFTGHYKDDTARINTGVFTVSIIICTYNRWSHLRKLMAALEKQDYPHFEVIVVNGPSTDESFRIKELFPRVRYVEIKQRNISISRNTGINAESGKLAHEVFLCIQDKRFKATYGKMRPDVAIYFNDDTFTNCGFECELPIHMLEAGINTIKLEILSRKKIVSDTIQFTFTLDSSNCFRTGIKEPYTNLSNSSYPIVFPETKFPLVSIIVSGTHPWNYSLNCFLSILRKPIIADYEVIFIENGNSEEMSSNQNILKNVQIVKYGSGTNISMYRNRAAALAKGSYLVFIENNVFVLKGWLDALIHTLNKNVNAGAIGSKIIARNGNLVESGSILWKNQPDNPSHFYRNPEGFEYNYVKEVDYCSSKSFAIKKDLFSSLNGFDENFTPGTYEDADMAIRIRALGLNVIYQPKSEVILEYCPPDQLAEHEIKLKSNLNLFSDKWDKCHPSVFKYHSSGEYLERERLESDKIVLYIDHCIPLIDQDGASFITFQYLRALRSMGCKIVFWSQELLATEPYTGILQQLGIEVIYGEVSFEEYLKKYGSFITFSFVSQPMGSLPYVKSIRKYTKAKIFYMAHDLHFLREIRAKSSINYEDEKGIEKTRNIELEIMKNSDISLFFSEHEVQYLKIHYPEIQAISIPWIQTVNALEIPVKIEDRKDLVFVGAFGHLPNFDAVLWFHNEILPIVSVEIPGIKTIILGSNPPETILKLHSDTFIVTGYVKEIDPYFENARVFISPLRFGAGFKTKNALAMSHGLPLVTTSTGAEGMKLTEGVNVLIAEDALQFAQKIIEIYQDPKLWKILSINSVEHVAKHYSPEGAKDFISTHLFNPF